MHFPSTINPKRIDQAKLQWGRSLRCQNMFTLPGYARKAIHRRSKSISEAKNQPGRKSFKSGRNVSALSAKPYLCSVMR